MIVKWNDFGAFSADRAIRVGRVVCFSEISADRGAVRVGRVVCILEISADRGAVEWYVLRPILGILTDFSCTTQMSYFGADIVDLSFTAQISGPILGISPVLHKFRGRY